MIRSELIRDPTAVAALGSAWNRLAQGNPAVHPFATYHWFASWWATFGGDAAVVALYDGRELVGAFPLMFRTVRRGPALSVRFDYDPRDEPLLARRPRWRLLPVMQVSPPMNLESGNLSGGVNFLPTREPECLTRVFELLRRLPGWHLGLFPCPETDAAAWLAAAHRAGLAAYLRDPKRSFFLAEPLLPWDEYIAGRSQKFRWTMRRAAKLASEAGLHLTTEVGSAACRPLIEDFFGIGRRTWKMAPRADADFFLPVTPDMEAFNTALCGTRDAVLQPVLHRLVSDTWTGAATLSLRVGNKLVPYITFYDPKLKAMSPGRLLTREMFTWASDNGVETIDWDGFTNFVQYFSNRQVVYRELVVFQRRPYARLLQALFRMTSPDRLGMDGAEGSA